MKRAEINLPDDAHSVQLDANADGVYVQADVFNINGDLLKSVSVAIGEEATDA